MLVDGSVSLHEEVGLRVLAGVPAVAVGPGARRARGAGCARPLRTSLLVHAGIVSWVSQLARSSLGDHSVLVLRQGAAGAPGGGDPRGGAPAAELCVFSIAAGDMGKGKDRSGGGDVLGTPVGEACVDFCGRHTLPSPSADGDSIATAAFHPLDFSLSVVWSSGVWQASAGA